MNQRDEFKYSWILISKPKKLILICLGLGPDAFFYVGKMGTSVSSANSIGILIPYPASQAEKALETHNSSKIKLMLTGDLKTNQIGWLSVWCRKYKINFGHVNFPAQGIKTISTKYRNAGRGIFWDASSNWWA